MSVSQERFLQLLSRKLAGEATIQELAELEEFMQENDEQKKFAEQIMINLPGSTENDEHEADAAFAAHSTKMQLRGHTPEKISSVGGTRSLAHWAMRIAAVLIIVAVGIYTFKRLGKNKEPVVTPNAEVSTAMGARTKAVLSDGTTYWLNAGSKLTYEKTFGKNSREVSLTGEAFFDVVKLTGRPFIVHTSGIDIKVLGTAFNVKSYPDDKYVEITLYRGFLKVFRQQDSESKAIQLRPNEKLLLTKQDTPPTATISHTDSGKKDSERDETAWIYSRLEFHGDSFEELAKKMERWYNVTIVFKDQRVKKLTFSGAFYKETLAQALDALREAGQFNYKIKDNEISIESSQ